MRKLCWWACSCAAAIFLSVYLLPEAFPLPAGIICALGAVLLCLFFKGKHPKTTLCAFGLAVGFLWTGCYTALVRAPAHALVENEPQSYSLTVTSFPNATSRGSSFTARLSLKGAADPLVQVYAEAGALSLRPGDEITATLSLSSSDFLRGESVDYYQSKGIYLLGYVRGEVSLFQHPEQIPVRFLPQYVAKALKDSVARSFPDDVSGFVTALITGDKSLLPTGLYAAFQRSGLSHVVAVSGLHISFLAAMIALLFYRQSRRRAALTILSVFFFAALAGSSPSAYRAAFMCAFPLLAPLFGREEDPPTSLSVSLVILLLQCPYSAASISLQLSFAAVVGIYLISGPLCRRWFQAIPKWDKLPLSLLRKLLNYCASSLSATLGALLFTTPLAAFHFGSFSLVGPLTNLLTLWAVSIVFLCGLLTALAGLFLPGIAIGAAQLVALPARWVILVVKTLSNLPFTSLTLSSIYLLGWFIMAYAVLLLFLFAKQKPRFSLCVLTLIPTLCAALLMNVWPILNGSLTVAALDVGQGASTLFYSRGRAVLVDCGGNGWDDPGDVAADYLQSLGASRLDALVLTHFHSDHACGVAELLSRIEVPLILAPDVDPDAPLRQEILALAQEYGCVVEFLLEDATLTFGDASLQIFEPLGKGSANEEGLSVLCSAGSYDVLVTGDMDSGVEKRLIKYKSLPDIELLIVGHHGSKSSTSEEFLLSTMPESAIISSGYNSYGHPALETLERLGAAGCDIYRTDLMGTVRFTIQKEELTR